MASANSMKLSFWGAARQVTGSMYLLEFPDSYRILIDCGAEFTQHHRRRGLEEFPFDPEEIDVVLLTHAHIDHSGNLPELVRLGYRGQVLCTAPTADLSMLLLQDHLGLSSKPEDEDLIPIWMDHLYNVLVPIKPSEPFEVKSGISITFYPCGHLLGAASILVEFEGKRVLFSGDRGRMGYPMLPDPSPLPDVDYLISESTYGGRQHSSEKEVASMLRNTIMRTCVERPGRLIIPAFSVGRTQTLLYELHRMYDAGLLPPVPIFTDSPLAARASNVYQRHVRFMSEEAKTLAEKNGTLFDFDQITFIEKYRESKDLANYSEPCIIISSSGMITGGRINLHVKANLGNQYATILLIGYAAEGTIGHDLMTGQRYIQFKNRKMEVRCDVVRSDVFSGHADQQELLEFIHQFDKSRLKQVFLTHGDEENMGILSGILNEEGYDCQMPAWSEQVML